MLEMGRRGTNQVLPALLVTSAESCLSAEPGHLLQKCVATMKVHTYKNSKPHHLSTSLLPEQDPEPGRVGCVGVGS